MRFESILSELGFSTNSLTERSSCRWTRPYAVGSGTGTSASVAFAPVSSCWAICFVRSMSVSTSPLSIRKRSSSSDSAYFSAPAVPRGSGSSTKRSRIPRPEPSPSTFRTLVARNPQDMITSSTPCWRSHSSMNEMNGRSTSGTTGLGTVDVSGRRRLPSPPTRIAAWMPSPPSYALIDQARRTHGVRVQRLAPVDHQIAAHGGGDQLPVEIHELGPLGHQDYGVGVGDGREGRVSERDPPDELASLLLGHGVMGHDGGAVGVQPGGQHQRGCLAHVIGVRLEGEAQQRHPLAHEAAEVLLELADHASLLQFVDLDHGGEELEVIAGVAGQLLQGVHVLRKAAASEADARLQELRPDAVVETHPPRHLHHL